MKKRQKIRPQKQENPAGAPPQPGIPTEIPKEERPKVEAVRPKVRFVVLVAPAVSLVVYLYFWFGPTVTLRDPWGDAAVLMDSAMDEKDPVRKQQIFEKSGAELKKLSAMHPYHARVHFMLALYYLRTSQLESAIKESKEAIRLGSGSVVNRVDDIARQVLVEATITRAQGFLDKNDTDSALAVLRDSYADAPNDKQLLLNLGKLSLWKKDFDASQRYLEAALKVDPKNAEVYMTLGDVARLQGQTPRAIEYLEKAIALNSNLTEAKNLLATVRNSPQNN